MLKHYLETLSDSQFHRLRRKVWERINRAFSGGTQFGIDWPTLCAVTPGFADILLAMKREWSMRVEEHERRNHVCVADCPAE